MASAQNGLGRKRLSLQTDCPRAPTSHQSPTAHMRRGQNSVCKDMNQAPNGPATPWDLGSGVSSSLARTPGTLMGQQCPGIWGQESVHPLPGLLGATVFGGAVSGACQPPPYQFQSTCWSRPSVLATKLDCNTPEGMMGPWKGSSLSLPIPRTASVPPHTSTPSSAASGG